jgi:hypothetical protein
MLFAIKALPRHQRQYRSFMRGFEGQKKDSGGARQGETANTRNVQPPESP